MNTSASSDAPLSSKADRAGSGRAARWIAAAALAALALAVRLPNLRAAYPYINYVDEGHILHRVTLMLRERTWDPGWYYYPPLPSYTVAAAAVLVSPLYALSVGHSLADDLSPSPPFTYDRIEPGALVLVGRSVCLALSLLIVLQCALLARRLGGETAAWIAAAASALLPALAVRGTLVSVDGFVTVFVLLALDLADRARRAPGPGRLVWLAGAAAGLAASSKYPAGLVGLGVVASLAAATWTWRARLRAMVTAALAAIVALLVTMPPLTLRTTQVVAHLRTESQLYASQRVGLYWEQILRRAEWDLPYSGPEIGWVFLFLTAAGLAVALATRRHRVAVAPWLVYAAFTIALLAMHPGFRAFRNLLPLSALATVLVGLLGDWLASRVGHVRAVTALGTLMLAALFLWPLLRHGRERARFADSRAEAVDWLASRGANQPVLVMHELAVLPSELARLGRKMRQVGWTSPLLAEIAAANPRWLLLGDLQKADGPVISAETWSAVEARFERVATFGETLASVDGGTWKGNRQQLSIWRRKRPRVRPEAAQPGRLPGFSATPPAAHSGQAASE